MDWDEAPEDREWPKIGVARAAAFAICAVAFWIYILTHESGYVRLLDDFNLVIHEGGHFIFSPFGKTAHFLGGTLLQCLLPAAFGVVFWRSRQPAGFAFSGVWLGENFLNVARYIADAQDMALPLVGGGMHDWNTLLSGTFLLRHCRLLGGITALAGWCVMLAAAAWYESLFIGEYFDS